MAYKTEATTQDNLTAWMSSMLSGPDPNQILLEFCSPRCVMVRCMVMETEPQWTR